MSAELIYLPDGAQLFVGRPAKPLPDAVNQSIKLATIESGIASEAHLPHAFIPGIMREPGAVLVILSSALPDLLSRGVDEISAKCGLNSLFVLPLSQNSELWQLVRQQNCRLF